MKREIFILLIFLILISSVSAERYIVEIKGKAKASLTPIIVSSESFKDNEMVVIEGEKEEILENYNVLRIEEDYIREVLDTPWNFEAIGLNFYKIDESFGNNVKIAVLDTGVDYNLLDVNSGWDFVNNDSDVLDDNGHGTIISYLLKNPDGLPLKGAEIYAVKVINENGTGFDSDIIQGIEWAVLNNIDIVSMSFGGEEDSSFLEEAVDLAYDNGVLLIAATGNNGDEIIIYPADYEGVISVGSVNENLEKSDFSNLNVELVAPGENIPIENGFVSGTSFSVPHVGVVASATWSDNPEISNVEVREKLQETAIDLGEQGFDEEFGYGLVNYVEISEYQELFEKVEEVEERLEILESWKETIESIIFSNGASETFPWFLDYFTSSIRKKIVCGYAEDNNLTHIEQLGYICDITSRTLISGRVRTSCRCKRL